MTKSIGDELYTWAADLFPLNRSLTGSGNRATLEYLRRIMPMMRMTEIPSGTPVFDWLVPDEWNVKDAYIVNDKQERIVDWRASNLHLVGYSAPFRGRLSLDELQGHLHSLPDDPNAIPYVTSYYRRRWGFCMRHCDRERLVPGNYQVVVDTTLEPGSLTIGDVVLLGEESSEVLLSTYICHPSMANNEVSGPVVTAALTRWLTNLPRRRFTYRIVFAPETIGALAYLSRNAQMKERTVAGFVVTCVGDDRAYSYVPSRRSNTLADRVARHVLRHKVTEYKEYSFLERGSDERQYCSPTFDMPVVSVMRSKYGTYPEYHTSRDDLSVISPRGLNGAFEVLQSCLTALEKNLVYRTTCAGEPQMSRRGLYPDQGAGSKSALVQQRMNILAYADGKTDLLSIAETIQDPVDECARTAEELREAGLLECSAFREGRDRHD